MMALATRIATLAILCAIAVILWAWVIGNVTFR